MPGTHSQRQAAIVLAEWMQQRSDADDGATLLHLLDARFGQLNARVVAWKVIARTAQNAERAERAHRVWLQTKVEQSEQSLLDDHERRAVIEQLALETQQQCLRLVAAYVRFQQSLVVFQGVFQSDEASAFAQETWNNVVAAWEQLARTVNQVVGEQGENNI